MVGPSIGLWFTLLVNDSAETEVRAALGEAGLDFRHNEEIQPSRVWVNNHPDVIEKVLT